MKKIAVITSGLLPMPAIKDGAIEMLLQHVIDYNENNHFIDMDVYSIYDNQAEEASKNIKNTKFVYVKINKILNSILFNILRVFRKLGYKDPNFQHLYINEVIKKINEKNYDYILVESDNHFAYKVLKKTNIPTILYLHNDKLNSNTKKGKFIIEKVKKVFVVSDFIKKQVLTLGKEYDNKVEVILNGIDYNLFDRQKYIDFKEQYRQKYGIVNNDFVFLFVGRIEPNKGVLELVKAFNKANIDSKLVIIGGSFHSSNKKSKYYSLVYNEAKANNNIIFTGYVKHDILPYYYAMGDALVVPSIWEEPAGLVNIEAIASKLILIASNIGGIPEYTDSNTLLVDTKKNFIDNLSVALINAPKVKNQNTSNYDAEKYSSNSYCKRFEKAMSEVEK